MVFQNCYIIFIPLILYASPTQGSNREDIIRAACAVNRDLRICRDHQLGEIRRKPPNIDRLANILDRPTGEVARKIEKKDEEMKNEPESDGMVDFAMNDVRIGDEHKRMELTERRESERFAYDKEFPPPPGIDETRGFSMSDNVVDVDGELLPKPPPVPKDTRLRDDNSDDRQPRQVGQQLSRLERTGPNAVPVVTDSVFSDPNLAKYGALTDQAGILHRPRSRSPFTKPGLWEPNPDNPHNRDHANKWAYLPQSVGVDWLSGQLQWGGHWAVPAAGTGGTNGMSTVHFPTIGEFLKIPDDYD